MEIGIIIKIRTVKISLTLIVLLFTPTIWNPFDMAIQFNRREEILNRLQQEGKILQMDSDEFFRNKEAFNNQVLEVKREYQEKERMSIIAASKVILT